MDTKKKIRLLIFIPTLECGGTEKYVSVLCNHIDTDRFEVILAILNDTHPFYEIKNGIEVIDLGVNRVRNSLFKIKKLVKQKQPDIIFSNANHLNLLFAISRWMFPKEIKIIARESSIISINSRRASLPGLYGILVKKYFGRLDHILCQSAFMQNDLVSKFNFPQSKTSVISNPVEEIAVASTAMAVSHSPKFITVARLSEEKGIDRLINIVAQLPIPFKYYIIGEGEKRGELQNLINDLRLQDSVFLTGEKINPYHNMEDAALMLCGSRYEGFPNSLLEGGMLGIPVVAFDAPGGISEIITHGENGLLVKDNDEAAFCSSIEKALRMEFNRDRIMTNTKKRYSIDAIMGQIEALFASLLEV